MSLVVEAPKIANRKQWESAVGDAISETLDILRQDLVPPQSSRNELLSFIEGQTRGRRARAQDYPKEFFELYLTKDLTGRAYSDIILDKLNSHGVMCAYAKLPNDNNPNLPGIRIRAFF